MSPAPAAAAAAGTAAKGAGASSAGGGAGAGTSSAGGGAGASSIGSAVSGGGGQSQQESDDREGNGLAVLLGLLLSPLLILLLVIATFIAIVGGVDSSTPQPGGAGTIPAGSEIPAVYWPIYQVAGEHYGVSPYLLASIHKQETGFSTHPSSRGGLNSFGCCGGPMQFNIRGGTWDQYKNGFRPISNKRPASYPLQRTGLPSCAGLSEDTGCAYDDFDAIAAAAMMLSKNGASNDLYSPGTRRAVCRYIGACSEVDNCTSSINQYCEVLPRARDWELRGAAPSATGDGAKAIVDGAVQIASRQRDTYVCSGHRPDDHDSDHRGNDATKAARDIGVRGVDCIVGPPGASLDRAVVEIGASLGRRYSPRQRIVDSFNWRGFRIQIIWRTPAYGGHMGHIHIGATRQSESRGT